MEKGPLTRKRVGLKVTGRGIIREHQPVYIGDQQIGMTTSGTHCPYLGVSGGHGRLWVSDIRSRERLWR